MHNLLDEVDVLTHFHTIQTTTSLIPASYELVTSSDLRYKPILLQAKSLQARIFHYDHRVSIPLSTPLVYLSKNESDLPIIIDTGASCSLTPLPTDFDGPLSRSDVKGLSQVSGQATVAGTGTVSWNIEDVHGTRRTLATEAYYVPSATVRLFSPQVYIGTNAKASLTINQFGACLTLRCGSKMKFPINTHTKLPFMLTEEILQRTRRSTPMTSHLVSFHLGQQLSTTTPIISAANTTLARRSVQHRDNYNLHPNQKELLDWHCRFSHADMQRIQMLLSTPHTPRGATSRGELHPQIVTPILKGSSSCQIPKCEACQYAKQRRTTPFNPRHPDSLYEEGALSVNALQAGDKVSCDQYMCSTLGRLAHTLGKEDKAHQLSGGTIFIDHATNYIFNNHQINLTASATVRSKHACEQHFDQFGVKIRRYASDNSPFTSKEWVTDCDVQHQSRTLTGVGAQHQNYMERHIQVIFNWARASLLHFVLHWPQQANTNLWPFAIDYAVYIWNSLPARNHRLSPHELFSGNRYSNYHHLQRAHVFGCPVFVLDAKLHDSGKKIPKWSMRSRRGIYLGVSPHHNSTVHLVLNPATGSITPQYHLVFDDTFSTVFSNGQFDEHNWLHLINHGHELHQSLLPDSSGQITQPPDCVPFDATPLAREGAIPSVPEGVISSVPEGAVSTSSVDTKSSLQPTIPMPVIPSSSSSSPTVTFNPTIESLSPSPVIEAAPTIPTLTPSPKSQSSPTSILRKPSPPLRRSTRSTAGIPPEKLSFLARYAAQYDIRRPHIQGSTQVNFTNHSPNQLPRVSGEQINRSHLTSLKWDCLLRAVSTKLGTLSSFIADHQHHLSYSFDAAPLVEYLNPAALQAVIPVNLRIPIFVSSERCWKNAVRVIAPNPAFFVIVFSCLTSVPCNSLYASIAISPFCLPCLENSSRSLESDILSDPVIAYVFFEMMAVAIVGGSWWCKRCFFDAL